MRLKSIADHYRTVNLADYLGKVAGNYNKTNDVTALITTALTGSASTVLQIPPGQYLVNDLTVPAALNRHITIQPLGEVEFWYNSATPCMEFDCQPGSLWSAQIIPTAIADYDNYPAGSADQRLTRLTMNAAGYLVGDVVHIEEDLLDASGVPCAEYARVVETDSATYITVGRKLYYGYTTPANIRVRRISYEAAPKFKLLPGIKFVPNEDETSALAMRTYAVYVKAAIDPVIHAEFASVYSTSIRMLGVYQGLVDYKGRDLHVDYTLATDATGVGVELNGCCYGTRVRSDVDRGGNAVIFGVGSTYSGSFSANGAPMDCHIERVRGTNLVRAGVNCSWAVRPKFHDISVVGSAETAGSDGNELDVGISISAVDPWIGKLVVQNAQAAVGFRDFKNIGGTFVIDDLHHSVSAQPSGIHSPIFKDTTTAGQTGGNVVVEVHGGRSSTPGSYPIERKSAFTYGITARFRDFTFANCTALARSASTRPDSYHIGEGCQYIPGTGEGVREGIIDCTDTNSLDINIESLSVTKNAASFPNGILRGVNGLAQVTKVGRIVCDAGMLLLKSSADATTSTHTITKLTEFGEAIYTDAAMAADLILNAGYGTALLDPSGAPRNVTLPDPAKCVGMTKTVRHIGAANNLNILTAAGTISPATPVLTTGLSSTWLASGTVWYLVGA